MKELIFLGPDGRNLLERPMPKPSNPPAKSHGEAVTLVELQTTDILAGSDFAHFEAGFTGTAMVTFAVNTASTTGVLSARVKTIGRGMVDTTAQLMEGVQVSTGQWRFPTFPITKGVTYAMEFSAACNVTVQVIGVPGIVAGPEASVQLSGSNVQLVPEATFDWDGVETSITQNVPLNSYTGIKIAVDNTNCNLALTLTFEEFVSSLSDNREWGDGNGAPVGNFAIAAAAKGTYGPFTSFPKFLGGQIRLSAPAGTTPSNAQVTKVTIMGVD